MTRLKHYSLVLFILFIFNGNAQQSNQKIEMNIDAIGNAEISISMTMNAQQWQIWNSNYGNNPSALKRDIQRNMPAFFLDGFNLEKDDMNRSFKLKLNAYGVCEIDKRGRWMVNTDQKNAQLTKLADNQYMLVSTPVEFGGTVQQTYIISFPKEANNIKTDTDAFSKSVFKFEMDDPSSNFNFMRWSGLALLLIGGAWSGKNFSRKT